MLKNYFFIGFLFLRLLFSSSEVLGSVEENPVQLLLQKGNKLCRSGEYDLGMKAYTEALSYSADLTPQLEFKLLLRVANIYASLQSFDRAANAYDLAAKAYSQYELGKHPEILLGYGIVAYGKGNPSKAQEYYETAIQVAKTKKDHRTVLTGQLNMANLMESKSKYDIALDYYSSLENEAIALRDSVSYCYALWGQGDCLLKLNAFSEAEEKLLQALEVCKSIGAYDRLAEIQGSMAKLKLGLQQYEAATEFLLAEKVGKDSLLGAMVVDHVITLEEGIQQTEEQEANFFQATIPPKWSYSLLLLLSVLVLYAVYSLYQHFAPQPTVSSHQLEKNQNIHNQHIDTKELQQILDHLQSIMSKEKLYLDKNLDIQSLAKRMEVNKNKLSKAINYYKKVNFKQYINDLRIDEAKRLLTDEETLARYTIESIALKCGFKTKVNFNYVFKQKLQQTPSEFIVRGGHA